MMVALQKVGSAQPSWGGRTERPYLPPLIGAWCWRRRASHPQHRMRWKNFAALIGDLFMLSCGGKVSGQRRQRILPRGFLRSYWSAENSVPSAKRKDDFVLFCLGH